MGLPLPTRNRTKDKMSSDELKTYMKRNGFSNREFAELLGVTENAVKYWRMGTREFSMTNSRLVRMFQKYPQLLREF